MTDGNVYGIDQIQHHHLVDINPNRARSGAYWFDTAARSGSVAIVTNLGPLESYGGESGRGSHLYTPNKWLSLACWTDGAFCGPCTSILYVGPLSLATAYSGRGSHLCTPTVGPGVTANVYTSYLWGVTSTGTACPKLLTYYGDSGRIIFIINHKFKQSSTTWIYQSSLFLFTNTACV